MPSMAPPMGFSNESSIDPLRGVKKRLKKSLLVPLTVVETGELAEYPKAVACTFHAPEASEVP